MAAPTASPGTLHRRNMAQPKPPPELPIQTLAGITADAPVRTAGNQRHRQRVDRPDTVRHRLGLRHRAAIQDRRGTDRWALLRRQPDLLTLRRNDIQGFQPASQLQSAASVDKTEFAAHPATKSRAAEKLLLRYNLGDAALRGRIIEGALDLGLRKHAPTLTGQKLNCSALILTTR